MGSSKSKWLNYRLPDAERIDFPDRDRSVVTATRPIAWPAEFADLHTNRRDPGQVGDDGRGSGTPMQLGTPATKTFKVGKPPTGFEALVYAAMKGWSVVEAPRPKLGFWWTTGYPTPSFDRHATLVAPDGDVYEFIQLSPLGAAHLPWATDANSYALWRGGVMVEGRSTTATGLPRYRYLWTPYSAAEPHVGSMIVPDYVGADGLLQEGPRAGSRVVLDRGSASYLSMRDLGGECAAMAEAGAKHGWVVIDRNGYSDVTDNRTQRGAKPHPPAVEMQPGDQWRGTNIRDFTVRLGDLREAV